MPTASIIGCSGYTGQETLDRVLAHPELELVALGSDSLAGELASALDIRLNGSLPAFVANAEALASGADVLFVCLGHDEAAALEPPADTVVVDLSGAHRLRDSALYDSWYGFTHPRAETLAGWSYALPELYPPTGTLIAKPSSHAGFVLENLSPYRAGSHQHAPELEQALGFPVCFVPHLLPLRRGLLATCYARAGNDAHERLEDAYADSDVVRMLPEGMAPELGRVQGTDTAEVALFEDRPTGKTIVACAIDNLGKGAAGQAVQNTNLALGLEETAGLRLTGVLV